MTKLDRVIHFIFILVIFFVVLYVEDNVIPAKSRIETKTEAKFIGIIAVAIYLSVYYGLKILILKHKKKKK